MHFSCSDCHLKICFNTLTIDKYHIFLFDICIDPMCKPLKSPIQILLLILVSLSLSNCTMTLHKLHNHYRCIKTVSFVPLGTGSATKFPCLPGTYSNRTDLFDASQCDICDEGKYCPGGEAAPRGACPPGFYCPEGTRVAEQFPCPNRTYNPEFGRWRQDQCLNCTQGHFCEKGSVQPSPCPIGGYGHGHKVQLFLWALALVAYS